MPFDVEDVFFEAGVRTEEIEVGFTPQDVVTSLTASTYSLPRTVRVHLLGWDNIGPVVDVVIESLTVMYRPFEVDEDRRLGCYELPEWLVTGRVLQQLFNPYTEISRVRMVLSLKPGDSSKFDDVGTLQVCRPINPIADAAGTPT